MDWLGVHNAFIYTFETPIIHLNHEPFQMPEELLLKAMQRKGKVSSIPAVRQRVRTDDIYNMERRGIREQVMLVVLPLYSNEMLYGILLCDLTSGSMENGEFLGNQESKRLFS